MDVLQSLVMGFSVALTPTNLLFCMVGVATGTLIGVLPGIGPSGTIAILLPITFGVDPTSAIIMFAGIYYGAQYGGSTTSVLIATPGESASVVTVLDGHQLALQGHAGKALGMCAISSFVSGTLGVIALMLLGPPLAAFALSFGPPEYFALLVSGLIMVTFLGGKSMIKALISGCIGLLLGTVGLDPIGGKERFTFDQMWLMDGISFVIVAMSLFAISEVLVHVGRERRPAIVPPASWRSVYPTWRDVADTKWTMLRAFIVGFIVGVLPGAGATVASFMAYTIEKRVSKYPERFGTGVIEGVVAPEGANNAAAQGALVPLLTLGIPGSGVAAMMLGAMVMWGLRPGPQLFQSNPQFVWGLIASMYVGNVLLLVLNLPLVPVFAAILTVPYKLLYPFIILFTMIGVYSLSYSLNDLALLFVFSVAGYLMNNAEFPAAPALLALVLGPMVERSLNQSLTLSHGSLAIFFTRPISAVLMLLAAALLVGPALRGVMRWRAVVVAEESKV